MSEPMIEWVSGEFVFCLFASHAFKPFDQISLTDASPRVGVTRMTRRRLTLPSIRRPRHHF